MLKFNVRHVGPHKEDAVFQENTIQGMEEKHQTSLSAKHFYPHTSVFPEGTMGNSRQCLFCSLAAQPSTELNALFIFNLSLRPENTMIQEMSPTCQWHLSAARLPPLFYFYLCPTLLPFHIVTDLTYCNTISLRGKNV